MKITKIFAIVLLASFLGVIVIQISKFLDERKLARQEFDVAESDLLAEQAKQERLEGESEYYLLPANFEKALRERFNYKYPGEKTIILVPESQEDSQ